MSRSMARRIILGGGVELEPSRDVKPGRLVRDGDVVVLYQHTPPEELLFGEVRVLATHAAFVVFDKPSGMLVHPTARAFQNTLVAYGEQSALGPLRVVHRLDQETSGLVVMARTKDAARSLSELFGLGGLRKVYRALVLDPDETHAIGATGGSQVALGFDQSSVLPHLTIGRGDWPAQTRWRCVDRCGDVADLEVELIEAGRQHQIRAHLSLAGTPVLGDKLYLHGAEYYKAWIDGEAEDVQLRSPRHMLHAWRLSFAFGDQPYQLEAPLPSSFASHLRAAASLPRG